MLRINANSDSTGLLWGAALRKVPEGAWVPLMIGIILYVLCSSYARLVHRPIPLVVPQCFYGLGERFVSVNLILRVIANSE